jgi:hypothetical protein
MPRTVSAVVGLELVVKNLSLNEQAMKKFVQGRVKVATNRVHKRVRKNLNKVDHSLKRLRELGHPYAVRNPRNPHRRIPWTVHRQSGDLLRALMEPFFSFGDDFAIGFVEVDEGIAPHARWVLFGTPTMIARNFLARSLDEVRNKILEDFTKGRGAQRTETVSLGTKVAL